MADRFSRAAKYYDRWHLIDKMYHPMHDYVVERIRRILDDCNNTVVHMAEIGVGTGVTTEAVLQAHSRAHIIGADPSVGMMALAVERLKEAGFFNRATLLQGEFQEVIRAVGNCQVVGSVCTFHNIEPEKRLAVCRHAFDLLVPGGMYISGDKVALDDSGEYLKLFDAQITAMAGYPTQFERNFWRLHELDDHLVRITESELLRMLEGVGFEDVRLERRFGIYAVVTARKPNQ